MIEVNEAYKVVSKGLMIDSCSDIINEIFNLNNVKYFSDSLSSYSNISYFDGSVYNIQT